MMKKLLALLMALAMVLSVSAVFAETAAEETAAEAAPVPDTLLATVNGVEIRENNETLQQYLNDILAQDDSSNENFRHVARMYAMLDAIQTMLIDQKTAAAFTEEEIDSIRQDAREEWQGIVNQILEQQYNVTEDTPEDEQVAARAEVLSTLESYYGVTEESYVASAPSNAFARQVTEQLKADNPDLTATEEEIQQAYNDMAAEELEYFGNDVASYEYYKGYYGYTFHYIPEGYRGILHILMKVDEELLNNWKDLTARLEEARNPSESTGETEAPAEEEEPVTEEMVEAARQAILDSQKEKLDTIMERLEKGEPFETLIAEFGEDPGMEVEENLKNGYLVHADSIQYDADFTKAAAALEKVGDYSSPVVSQFGIHIVYYLRDVPAGVIEMSGDERAQLQADIEEERLNLAISEMLDRWVDEADIVYTEEGEAWKFDQAVFDAYLNAANGSDLEDEAEAEQP